MQPHLQHGAAIQFVGDRSTARQPLQLWQCDASMRKHHPETTQICAIAGVQRTQDTLNEEHIIFKCAARMLLHTTDSFQLGIRDRWPIPKGLLLQPYFVKHCQMKAWFPVINLTSVQNTIQFIIHNIYILNEIQFPNRSGAKIPKLWAVHEGPRFIRLENNIRTKREKLDGSYTIHYTLYIPGRSQKPEWSLKKRKKREKKGTKCKISVSNSGSSAYKCAQSVLGGVSVRTTEWALRHLSLTWTRWEGAGFSIELNARRQSLLCTAMLGRPLDGVRPE